MISNPNIRSKISKPSLQGSDCCLKPLSSLPHPAATAFPSKVQPVFGYHMGPQMFNRPCTFLIRSRSFSNLLLGKTSSISIKKMALPNLSQVCSPSWVHVYQSFIICHTSKPFLAICQIYILRIYLWVAAARHDVCVSNSVQKLEYWCRLYFDAEKACGLNSPRERCGVLCITFLFIAPWRSHTLWDTWKNSPMFVWLPQSCVCVLFMIYYKAHERYFDQSLIPLCLIDKLSSI